MKTVTFRKKSAYKPLVLAVEQASRILLCLGEGDRFKMRLTDICKQVGIHKSKGHTILNTLIKFELVEKDPHRSGDVGQGVLNIIEARLEQH